MKAFLDYYFAMFDELLTTEHKGVATPAFKEIVSDTIERIKDSFKFLEGEKYTSLCLSIDKYFDEYIESK